MHLNKETEREYPYQTLFQQNIHKHKLILSLLKSSVTFHDTWQKKLFHILVPRKPLILSSPPPPTANKFQSLNFP